MAELSISEMAYLILPIKVLGWDLMETGFAVRYIERVQAGLAPKGTDGLSVQLHHLTMTELNGMAGTRGAIAEILASTHGGKGTSKMLHFNSAKRNANYLKGSGNGHPRQTPQHPSFRKDNFGKTTTLSDEFDAFRTEYWRSRSQDF